jgi:siroheme synthase-like protein
MSRTLPVFLRLEGRPCLVAGGGRIAWEKALRLIEAGAEVSMVAPEIAAPPRDLPSGHIRFVRRSFLPGDLAGHAVAVAATDDPDVQREVYGAAREAGVPVNVVDRPDLCDFIFGAVLRRGDLQIAVSTGGRFPLLASRLRDRLEEAFHPGGAAAVEEIGRIRDVVREEAAGDIPRLREILGSLLTEEILTLIQKGDIDAIRERIREWNSSPTP